MRQVSCHKSCFERRNSRAWQPLTSGRAIIVARLTDNTRLAQITQFRSRCLWRDFHFGSTHTSSRLVLNSKASVMWMCVRIWDTTHRVFDCVWTNQYECAFEIRLRREKPSRYETIPNIQYDRRFFKCVWNEFHFNLVWIFLTRTIMYFYGNIVYVCKIHFILKRKILYWLNYEKLSVRSLQRMTILKLRENVIWFGNLSVIIAKIYKNPYQKGIGICIYNFKPHIIYFTYLFIYTNIHPLVFYTASMSKLSINYYI